MFHLVLACLFSPSPEAVRSIESLSHHRFHIRQQAQEDLEALGSRAFSALLVGITNRDPEVRERCSRCLARILHRQPPPFSPSDTDMEHFPKAYEAKDQLKYYKKHRERLVRLRSLFSDRDGRYSQWIKETDLAIIYWYTLYDIRWTGARPVVLWRIIGTEKWLLGWHPPFIPEPPPSKVMPKADMGVNAKGGP